MCLLFGLSNSVPLHSASTSSLTLVDLRSLVPHSLSGQPPLVPRCLTAFVLCPLPPLRSRVRASPFLRLYSASSSPLTLVSFRGQPATRTLLRPRPLTAFAPVLGLRCIPGFVPHPSFDCTRLRARPSLSLASVHSCLVTPRTTSWRVRKVG